MCNLFPSSLQLANTQTYNLKLLLCIKLSNHPLFFVFVFVFVLFFFQITSLGLNFKILPKFLSSNLKILPTITISFISTFLFSILSHNHHVDFGKKTLKKPLENKVQINPHHSPTFSFLPFTMPPIYHFCHLS